MNIQHDAYRSASDLSAKLSSRSRHVCFLVGAGASMAAGIPDMATLKTKVLENIKGTDGELCKQVCATRNLEQALTHLRRIGGLLRPGEVFHEISYDAALRLDKGICSQIAELISKPTDQIDSFTRLGSWAARSEYHLPLEIFTTNYDVLLERGLESVGAAYFDGFVGNLRGVFRPDLVEQSDGGMASKLPSSFVRLWKLHGSANWLFEEGSDRPRIVRVGGDLAQATTLPVAIYPSDQKYDESRRVPFVVLMDRFRRALSDPETILVIIGFSFSDQHLNELIFDAALLHPRSEIVALCYSTIPPNVQQVATKTRNLTVLGATEGIIGGQLGQWIGKELIPDVWDGSKFSLGDFACFAKFLDRRIPLA